MKTIISHAVTRFTVCAFLQFICLATQAQITEISNIPLIGVSTGGAPPNIMLLLDTSTSMSWTHMPDQLEVVGPKQSIGYKSNECNSLYYNRNQVYTIPRDAANAPLPTPNFSNAPYNYFIDPTTFVNLGSSFKAHDANTVQNIVTTVADPAQAAYYFYFVPSATAPNYNYNTAPCNAADTFAAGTTGNVSSTGGKWYRVVVGSNSGPVGRADERQNFAIWYTYYRTRINLAKSSIGLAFESLSDTYRVGFLTVNPTLDANNLPTGTVQSSHYQPLADFNSSQRTLWYNKFYSQVPAGSSPAREALARMGRHYAGKTDGINNGMGTDPVKYACQKNFTIMTTDGYWNVAAEKSGLLGGPTNLSGTAWVGQQDGGINNPRTADSNANGLVPSGVFDGTLAQLPYTKSGYVTTKYSHESCNLPPVAGYRETKVSSFVTPQVKTVVTTPATNATQLSSRLVSFTRQSYRVTKQTAQYVIPMQKQNTTQFIWYNAATEQSQPVASCTGLTNCGPSLLTGSIDVPTGTCVVKDSPSSPDYIRVQCSGAVDVVQPTACTVGTGGCQINTKVAGYVPPTFVAGDTCTNPSTNSGYPNYLITTCTINAPNVGTPSTTASSASTTTVGSDCGITYAANENVVCSKASGFPTAWTKTSSCQQGTVIGSATQECQSVDFCNSAVAPFPSCVTTTETTKNVACSPSVVGNVTTTCSIPVDLTVTTVGVDPATCPIGTANPSAANTYNKIVCTTRTSQPIAGACSSAQKASSSNGWTATACAQAVLTGWVLRSQSTRDETWTYDNGTVVKQAAVVSPTVSLDSCRALPAPTVVPPEKTIPFAPVYVPYSATGGSSNSLADVAQYYYVTDLRPDMADIVPPAGSGPLDDKAPWQHMSTYVVGLGVSGTLPYKADYATTGTGTFADIRALSKIWPAWPDPSIDYSINDQAWNSPKSIDDFWHTAVNGRGKYFSATDPNSVVTGIQSSLQAIVASTGSSTGNTISDQINFTDTGLNFGSLYTTFEWAGDLRAFDSSNLSTPIWKAQEKLDAQTQANCDDRRIYVRDVSTVTKLSPFTLNTKRCADNTVSSALSDSIQSLISATSLTQYATMTTSPAPVNQKAQSTGASLVNYLRGQRQNEGYAVGQSGKLYRARTHVLGDIVNSKPQFVGAPYFNYADDGYYTFKTSNATRQNMIYVGGNDGMLHAFYAPPSTATGPQLEKQGQEAWAYIPTQVIPNLSKLADVSYSSNHRFYVDGTPKIGDVKFADGTWHTILVGGLGAGGKGYYALDITDPETPTSLWEFDSKTCTRSGCSVGYTFGQPVIGKMADGTWAVFLTSGYNNSSGQAALFVLNAQTGATIKTINAGTANAGSALGLSPISAWFDNANVDKTVARVYGGDLYGNMWRFETNSSDNEAAYRIGVAKDASGNLQPITMPPELGTVGGNAYVYYGTGKLVGASDFANTQQQTVYAIHDKLASSDISYPLRSVLTPYTTTDSLTIACTGNCTSTNDSGFLIDLAGSGEKVITPLALIGNTLTIITTQPQDNTCGTGGTSKAYFGSATNGQTVGIGYNFLTPVVGAIYLNSEVGGVILEVKVPGASISSDGVSATGAGNVIKKPVPVANIPPGTTRASWREIIQR